jgi:hypothetical protein
MSNAFHQLFIDGKLNIFDTDARTSNNGQYTTDKYSISLSSNTLTLNDLSNASLSSSVELNYLNKTGDVMAGTLNMNNNKILNVSELLVKDANNEGTIEFGSGTNEDPNDLTLIKTQYYGSNAETELVLYKGNNAENYGPDRIRMKAANLVFETYPDFQGSGNINNVRTNMLIDRLGKVSIYGELDMDSNKIVNVADPTADADGANKKYVDDAVSGAGGGEYLPLTGGTLTGELNVGGNLVASGEHLRIGVGMTIEDEYKGGTGPNLVSFTSSRPLTKFYSGPNELLGLNPTLSYFKNSLKIEGELDVSNNKIVNVATPSANTDATNKIYVDDKISNADFVSTGGGVINGTLNVETGQNDGITLKGSNGKYGFVHTDETTTIKTYIGGAVDGGNIGWIGTTTPSDLYLYTGNANTANAQIKLKQDYTTSFNNNKIIDIADPTSDNDGANKKYVDSKIVTNNQEIFKTYNITGRQFNNFGMWGGIVGDPDAYYTKSTRVYVPTNPVISTENVNDSILKDSTYQILSSPTVNPSAFQFYGIIYQDLSISTIKKGTLQVKLNIPYISDVDIWNQDTFMIQGILGAKPTFTGNNISVKCYAVETVNSVHGYSGGNIYGKNIDDSFPNNDQKWIREIEVLFNFNIPLDIPANQLYIYLQFTTNSNNLQNRYINFLFGGLTSPIQSTNSRDLMISGTAVYTKQNEIMSSTEPLEDLPNETTNHIVKHFVYSSIEASAFEPDETYHEIGEIEKREIEDDYIHSVKKVGDTNVNMTLYNNGGNEGIFGSGSGEIKIPLSSIYDCNIKLKMDTKTENPPSIIIQSVVSDGVNFPEVKSKNIILEENSDEWNTYSINFNEYEASYNVLDAVIIRVEADVSNVSLDDFNIHWVDASGNTNENHAYWKIDGDDTVLQDVDTKNTDNLTNRVIELEQYIELLKTTYTIE